MSITPLKKTKVVPIAQPLPPAWLRTNPTTKDVDGIGTSVLRVGPAGQLHRSIVETIESADEVVLAASFLLADQGIATALLEAAKRNRRVYVLTASQETVAKIVRDDDSFDARMVEEHKTLLNNLAEHVLLRSAPHFHAKALVVDPGSKPRGWVTTANFNKALRESVEVGVRLGAAPARAVAAWFARAFWLEADHELEAPGRLAKVGAAPGTPSEPDASGVFVTSRSHRTLRAEVIRLIEGATKELTIACYGLAAEHPALKAAAAKANAGVRVTVLTRPRPAVAEAVRALSDAGARVVSHDKLHAKVIVSDAGALVMTANIEEHGLESGFELGIVPDAKGTKELQQTLEDWSKSFPWSFRRSTNRDEHLGEFCPVDKGLRDGIRSVIEEPKHPVQLQPVIATDALRLEDAPDPALPPPPRDEFPRRVTYAWEVRPPRLPKGAKERFAKSAAKGKAPVPMKPRVFDEASQVYVLLERPDEVEQVRDAAARLGARVVVS